GISGVAALALAGVCWFVRVWTLRTAANRRSNLRQCFACFSSPYKSPETRFCVLYLYSFTRKVNRNFQHGQPGQKLIRGKCSYQVACGSNRLILSAPACWSRPSIALRDESGTSATPTRILPSQIAGSDKGTLRRGRPALASSVTTV